MVFCIVWGYNRHMKKNITITAIVVLLLALVFGFFYYKKNNSADYSIVYLTTGEVYIGQLATFPDLQLKNSYILQVTKDPTDATKNNFQLQPIKDALWAPKTLRLIEKNIIFYGPLSSESVIAKRLAEQK